MVLSSRFAAVAQRNAARIAEAERAGRVRAQLARARRQAMGGELARMTSATSVRLAEAIAETRTPFTDIHEDCRAALEVAIRAYNASPAAKIHGRVSFFDGGAILVMLKNEMTQSVWPYTPTQHERNPYAVARTALETLMANVA